MNYFFDTSALAKIYHREDDSDIVISIFNSRDNEIFVSELSVIEYYSVVYRKFREGPWKYFKNLRGERGCRKNKGDYR